MNDVWVTAASLSSQLHTSACGVFTPWNSRSRLYAHLPDNGSVRLLVITEKQYAAIEILVGRLSLEEKTDFPCEQLSIF